MRGGGRGARGVERLRVKNKKGRRVGEQMCGKEILWGEKRKGSGMGQMNSWGKKWGVRRQHSCTNC